MKTWRINALQLHLLVVVLGIALTCAFVRFDLVIRNEELTREAQQTLSAVSANINEVFYRRFYIANSLEAFVTANRDLDLTVPEQRLQFAEHFNQFTQTLDNLTSGVLSMQVAPGGIVSYVSQPDRNSQAVGHDLLFDDTRRDEVLRAIRDKRTIVDGPLQLLQGGNAVIARKAVFIEGHQFQPASINQRLLFESNPSIREAIPDDFWGLVTVLIDTDTVISELRNPNTTGNYDIALRGQHGLGRTGDIIYGDPQIFDAPLAEATVVLPDGQWLLATRNQAGLYPSLSIALIGLLLTLAALFAYRLHEKSQLANAESKAKSDFLAVISHEIRTPLNGIIGVASVLEKNTVEGRNRDLVNIIMLSSNSLLTLVNDILDFSKIESGSFILENRPFLLHENIKWIAMLIREQLREKDVEFVLNVSPDVSSHILGDEKRINQILLNLLNNAVKFTEHGYIRLDVFVQQSPGSKRLLYFKVSDSGIGIEKARLSAIFNAFTQASSNVTRKYGGTGLGLTIVRRLSEIMGGTVTVESEPGRGSAFTACISYLPLAPGVGQHLNPSEEDKPGASLTVSSEHHTQQLVHYDFSSLRVLVVEDNKLNQEILKIILGKLNATADFADDGEIALEKTRLQDYDLIFMDSFMPNMDGLTAAGKIRARDSDTNVPWIVSVTASVSDEHKDACVRAGMNDFMAKPLTIESVRRALINYLDQRSPDSK
ncbi:response regulator [Gammaproteobacteria bacterium LSUCC0112]|nr:response regulator [Gammaproteobacteria bacterium LSUCC0112]